MLDVKASRRSQLREAALFYHFFFFPCQKNVPHPLCVCVCVRVCVCLVGLLLLFPCQVQLKVSAILKKIFKKRLEGRARAAYFSGCFTDEARRDASKLNSSAIDCSLCAAVDPQKTSTSIFWFDTSHLTVDGQRNLLLSGSYARDHGAANVFPSILLPHGLQCQEVLVAKNLQHEKKEVRRSQRSLDVMTAEAPSHSRYQQSNAEVVGKKKKEKKTNSWSILYLKGQLYSIIKIQFRVWTRQRKGMLGFAL